MKWSIFSLMLLACACLTFVSCSGLEDTLTTVHNATGSVDSTMLTGLSSSGSDGVVVSTMAIIWLVRQVARVGLVLIGKKKWEEV